MKIYDLCVIDALQTRRRSGRSVSPECSKQCKYGGVCAIHPYKGSEYCSCHNIFCSKEYDPICGDDNYTYPNECVMQHNACIKQKRKAVSYKGVCGR